MKTLNLENGLRVRWEPSWKRTPNFLIEEGFLDLHLWVTYQCSNNCPHCYLRSMKNKSSDMSLDRMRLLMESISAYRKDWKLFRVTFYGAEPQSLDSEYYLAAMGLIEKYFPEVEYGMYTSLQKLDEGWFKVFQRIDKKNTLAMLAASYDGAMRGERYNYNLFRNIERMNKRGMQVGLMCVVNKSMLELGPKHFVDILEKYNISRFSLKPFLPVEGQWDKWFKYAADMRSFSEYAIAVHKEWESRGIPTMSSTLGHICHNNTASQNTGGYAIFIDGGLRAMYMGYRNKAEYLQCWGVIDGVDGFRRVVESPLRKKFLADQRMLHGRLDCLTCEHSGRCLAEVFKDEYDNSDECIGAKTFVDWAYKRYGVFYESGY